MGIVIGERWSSWKEILARVGNSLFGFRLNRLCFESERAKERFPLFKVWIIFIALFLWATRANHACVVSERAKERFALFKLWITLVALFNEGRERIALVALFNWERRAKRSCCSFLMSEGRECCLLQRVMKSNEERLIFSFEHKTGKSMVKRINVKWITLKKSESLFHKEQIAPVTLYLRHSLPSLFK